MKILVFGSSGQISSELKKFKNVLCLSKNEANFLYPDKIYKIIHQIKPIGIINPAAYTNVEMAEKNIDKVNLINAYTPEKIAQACNSLKIPFIHISTDYVFDGMSDNEYSTTDVAKPLNLYGKSKLLGENLIIKSKCKYVILRTSWIFSEFSSNFVKTILLKSKLKKELSIVDDQIGSPTPANELAYAIYKIMIKLLKEDKNYGLYHFAGQPNISWYNFTKNILSLSRNKAVLKPIKTDQLELLALRPKNSTLNCELIYSIFGIRRPNWKNALLKVINKIE